MEDERPTTSMFSGISYFLSMCPLFLLTFVFRQIDNKNVVHMYYGILLICKENEIMKFVGKCSFYPSFEEVPLCNRWRSLQEITSNEHAELSGPVPADTFTT